jgi:putative transposase
VFLDAKLSAWVLNLLRSESAANSFCVHAYCLMPDHLHFLAEGVEPASDLLHLVKSFKIKSSRQYSRQSERILWQKRFYEHILRATDSLEDVTWYIWLNPVRKGLVAKPDKYPFLGSWTGMEMPSTWNAPDWCPPWKKRRCPDL